MEKGNDGIAGGFNRNSAPSQLRITDIRFAKIAGAPMDCIMIKILTNSELEGYGEIRDWSSETYGLMLKSRLIGENPCNIDKIFRRIKQFGGHSRQGGGVSGIELALWDLAGKAYGVPVYQMLGGKFRDKVRVYSDTDCEGKPDGKKMGEALKKRMGLGFTFLKMDWGVEQLLGEKGALCAPLGYIDELKQYQEYMNDSAPENRDKYKRAYDVINIAHPFTQLQITEKGLDILEDYLATVRSVIGYDIPLAVDHCGHIGVTECIKLAKRAEKYNLAWLEDILPWQMTEAYKTLSCSSAVPLCTGEDIYLKENFRPILESSALSVIHPDILTSGGILETKKIGDMAQDHGAAMAIHMAETPIACLAAAHTAVATENFLALEFHSVDIPWWKDLVKTGMDPIIKDGFIEVSDAPGLGIEALNDEVIREHIHPSSDGIWVSTDEWNHEWSHDRLWS
ncbi:mandelate racemase/muconate lactonizing enzyme family protein [Breznakiella homolactica]|uniref:Mandelate racemase/muconate lactonizing enzyme family protein n=1 Tax=Breznakiella homolactica TaxID=2798577 RepID=A0A7T8B9X7_9SPIR|nr:mandelate racemase/muconate lactonizing enzyme family protein [Breznakiella homolactica]QQO10084.1 mandelate racemase/muconate lactonizing enzyme family protein [Breznakiella homolactica]